MFSKEKLGKIFSINIEKRRSRSGKTIRRFHQKGSILIGLIITMVVMAALGAGMVYLTTTSTFQELFANNHARAYYAAESGGRYASALSRQALGTNNPPFSTLNATFFQNEYTLANGDRFLISNWVEDASTGSMVVTFDSIGTTGSGFMQAKRKLSYRINPANQVGAGPGGYPDKTDFPTAVSDFDNVTTPGLSQYFNPTHPDDTQIKLVKDDPKTGSDPAFNLVSPYFTAGISWYTEENALVYPQLDKIRTYNDGLLSYNLQVKITPNETPANDGVLIAGMSFRLDDSATTDYTYGNMYGIAFLKIDKNLAENKWPDWYREPASSVWSDPGIGIRKLDSVDCLETPANSRCAWYGLENEVYYVVLFKRVGSTKSNGFYGKHTLLAYTKLANMSGVLDGINLRDWTTLMVKVTEEKGGSGDLYDYSSADNRYNTIKCFLQIPANYPRRIGSTPEAKDAVSVVKWDDADFMPINWQWVSGSAQRGKESDGTTINNMIVDASLNTLNYGTYIPSTTIKAREIGLHIYYRSEAANQIYYDNFYIDLSPSTGGGGGYIDGSGQVVVGP